MKLLARLAHCSFFHAQNQFRCRRSIVLRSIHQIASVHGSPAAAATMMDYPSWVLLHTSDCCWNNSIAADARTAAECCTSTGKCLRVAFDLAVPPATSLLHYECAEAARKDKYGSNVNIVAAHGDSVLLRMCRTRKPWPPAGPYDHFVYRAGGGVRPPSLSLLPTLKVMKKYEEGIGDPNCRPLLSEDTGILRRGDDNGEFLLARIDVLLEHSENRGVANLCILRPGCSHWEEKRGVPIVYEEGDEVMGSSPDMAIPVGERFLCWVVHHRGFILCDMADDASPKLRHVHLPGMPYDPNYYTDDLPPLSDSRNMGAAGASSLRFVAIEPRCCCGSFGRSSCPHSEYAFTITTWTLTLTMDEPMAWVKEGVMDCEELWALPGYEGIPRRHLQCPIVSLDNPDVICFRVVGSMADRNAWMIQVDTRRKVLLGAAQCTTDPSKSYYSYDLRQAKIH